MSTGKVERTLCALKRRFIEARVGDHWESNLSSSALSTATAVIALSLAARDELASRGAAWLIENQNDDGGWGDTQAQREQHQHNRAVLGHADDSSRPRFRRIPLHGPRPTWSATPAVSTRIR